MARSVHERTISRRVGDAMDDVVSKKHARPSTKNIVAAVFTFTLAFAILVFRTQRTGPALDVIEASDRAPFKLHSDQHNARPATVWKYQWNVTCAERRPDGVLKQVFLINDNFPGPTIEARSGDRIVVEVENGLLESGISIHWHGLRMQGTNNMDGAAGITQDIISPRERFVYDFTIADDQSGTFWYHAHSAVQRADGLFGGLVVHEPVESKKEQADELLLMIGDWYHRQGSELLDWYLSAGSFGMEPIPDSLLINGQGSFNCQDAVPARPLDCRSTAEPLLLNDVAISDPVKFRIINTGVYSGFTVGFLDGTGEVVALDGGNHVDMLQDHDSFGVLHPGERVDVLFRDRIPSSLSVSLDTTPYKFSNPALTTIQSFPLSHQGHGGVFGKSSKVLNLDQLTSSEVLPPAEPHTTVVLYVVSEKLAHLNYVPHGNINRTSWLPQTPALIELDREDWDQHQFVPSVPYNPAQPEWIDLVVNNLDEEDHPFHLHGYDFFVMSTYTSTYNWGSFDPFSGVAPPGGEYSKTPRKKDTVAIPRRGYAVLRFRADNPGLWMFHCHVLWHLASGMAMAFDIR